jgi:hypothetical protein
VRRADARRGWERRRRPSRPKRLPWRRRPDPLDEPPLDARDRAAIEAIRRELDLEFGQAVEARSVDEPDEPRAHRPWAFVVTLSVLVLVVAAAIGVALHGRSPSSREEPNRTTPAASTPAPAARTPPAAVAPSKRAAGSATSPSREQASEAPGRASRATPSVPETPAERRSAPPVAPAEPSATAGVGAGTADTAGGSSERGATAADDARIADSPPPLPEGRRPARAREQPPRVDDPPRAELPPLDYSKRRPSLPPRARTD